MRDVEREAADLRAKFETIPTWENDQGALFLSYFDVVLLFIREQRAIRADALADLHAKVETLRDEAIEHARNGDQTATAIVAYQTVLALIDGSSE